jgi:hypothetical protein
MMERWRKAFRPQKKKNKEKPGGGDSGPESRGCERENNEKTGAIEIVRVMSLEICSTDNSSEDESGREEKEVRRRMLIGRN